jgi:hypothetical protein
VNLRPGEVIMDWGFKGLKRKSPQRDKNTLEAHIDIFRKLLLITSSRKLEIRLMG